MAAEDFDIFFWEPQDTEIIPELLTAAAETHYDREPDSAWFAWKFGASPFGAATVCYARSRKDGRIAGNVSFGMYRMMYAGRELHAAVSYETFVHPDFQRQGLFMRLMEAAQEHSIERGVQLFFNFPNANSRHGFAKAGWNDAGGLQSWVKPLRPIRIVRRLYRRRDFTTNFKPDRVQQVHPGLNQQIRKLAAMNNAEHDPSLLSPIRSGEFLVWRFASYPNFHYRVTGGPKLWTIYRTGTRLGLREAQLMEIFWRGRLSARALRRLVGKVAADSDVEMVSFVCSAGHPAADRLKWAGFLPGPNNANFFTLGNEADFVDLDDASHWALGTIDLHTY